MCEVPYNLSHTISRRDDSWITFPITPCLFFLSALFSTRCLMSGYVAGGSRFVLSDESVDAWPFVGGCHGDVVGPSIGVVV